MQVQRAQNNNSYYTNFGMIAKIPSWQKTAKKVGVKLANALYDAKPEIEQFTKHQTVKIAAIKSRNLYNRGFKIVVSPTERKIWGRNFLDRLILNRAPYVSITVRNRDIKNNQTMKDLLILTANRLITDLKNFGYIDISSLV